MSPFEVIHIDARGPTWIKSASGHIFCNPY